MKKLNFFTPPIVAIGVTPFLVACQVSDQSKLDNAFNNLKVIENKFNQKLPKELTYPSSLGVHDFTENSDKDIKTKVWIQPNDQEGKIDVFAILNYGKVLPKTKKFSFTNYKSQKNTITSQEQLDEILDSLSIEFKVDKSQTLASQITVEDIFVVKGENILDVAYDMELNLKANEDKSQLLVNVTLKKDGFISSKKDFLVSGFLNWESSGSKKPKPLAPTDWPEIKNELSTFFAYIKIRNSLLANAREIADIGQRVSNNYVFSVLPKIDLESLKTLPEKLQNNFKQFFIKIKNISRKTEFLGLNTYSSWFYPGFIETLNDATYNKNTKIMINELKILMQELEKDFIDLAQSFNPSFTTNEIIEQLKGLNKINQLISTSKTETKSRGAIELVNHLFDTQLYEPNTNYIENLKDNCKNGACHFPQDNQEYFYNLALVYGQISQAILQSQYTLFANNLVAQESSVENIFLKSFEKQNALLLPTVEKAQLNEQFVKNVEKMYEFYEQLEINAEVRKFRRLFAKNLESVDDSFKAKLENIYLAMLDIEHTYTEPIASQDIENEYGGHNVSYSIGALVEKLDINLKEMSKKPFNSFKDFSIFFPQINNSDYFMKILKNNLLKAKNGVEDLNKLILKIIPQLEAIKNQEQIFSKVAAYDSLLTSLKAFQQPYQNLAQNIDSILEQPNIYNFWTMSNNVSQLNQLANAYISQIALDGIDFVKEQFLDPTYLVLPSKHN